MPHSVQDGDTLGKIAERYGASESDIALVNQLSAPFVLQVGQVLVVRGGSFNHVPAQVTATSYDVQDGDALSTIAQSFGVDMQAIVDANGLQDPYLLHPGQHLMIRGATPQASAARPARTVAPAARVQTAAPPAAVSTPTPAVSWDVVSIASRYLGTSYVWGGSAPSGFDCSGLVWYVYRKAGQPIPRDMWGQLQSGPRIARANLQPGDIVFFQGTDGPGLSHEGLYIGGGRFIHASDYGVGVIVSSLSKPFYVNHYYGATRPG